MFIKTTRFGGGQKPRVQRRAVAKRFSDSDKNIKQSVEKYIAVDTRQKIRSGKNAVAVADRGIAFDIEDGQGNQIGTDD